MSNNKMRVSIMQNTYWKQCRFPARWYRHCFVKEPPSPRKYFRSARYHVHPILTIAGIMMSIMRCCRKHYFHNADRLSFFDQPAKLPVRRIQCTRVIGGYQYRSCWFGFSNVRWIVLQQRQIFFLLLPPCYLESISQRVRPTPFLN
jgi:hypothetical protein